MTSRRTHRFRVPCRSWLSLRYPLPLEAVLAGVAATTATIAVFREICGNVRVCSVVVREFTEKRVRWRAFDGGIMSSILRSLRWPAGIELSSAKLD